MRQRGALGFSKTPNKERGREYDTAKTKATTPTAKQFLSQNYFSKPSNPFLSFIFLAFPYTLKFLT
jgi:hypothetical protein